MTIRTFCPICGEIADGLDGILCQIHWEKQCSDGFWDVMNALATQQRRFEYREAKRRAIALCPDFDSLPL